VTLHYRGGSVRIADSTQPSHDRRSGPRRLRILANPFSIENDEITATMKMKRRMIEERYRDLIQGLFERGSKNETSLH
jgi:long-subunit acyl-CoA synthetase (AMP-forming)